MSDEGKVVAVCIGAGGLPKHSVPKARVTVRGVEGDAQARSFHGGANRAVCLFSVEDALALRALGVRELEPGAVGENLLLEGLDFARLSPGDRLAVGDEIMLEIFDVREPCRTLKPVDARFPGLMVGRSGYVCRVLHEGLVRPEQPVRKLTAESRKPS